MAGRPPNENLALAILYGDKTYEGSEHSRCGTTTRYTKGNGCVHCARETVAEGRALRAAEKARKEEAAARRRRVRQGLPEFPETTAALDEDALVQTEYDKADQKHAAQMADLEPDDEAEDRASHGDRDPFIDALDDLM